MEFEAVSPRQLSMGLFLGKWILRGLWRFIVNGTKRIAQLTDCIVLMDSWYFCIMTIGIILGNPVGELIGTADLVVFDSAILQDFSLVEFSTMNNSSLSVNPL